MDMGLLHRPLQPAVRQLVVNGLIVTADHGAELAAGDRGDRRHLRVAGQRGVDPLGAGNGRRRHGPARSARPADVLALRQLF